MEKTINCADCGVEVIYNEKPGFPRKYCQVHSDARKASFKTKVEEQNKADEGLFKNASESKPTHTPQGEPLAKEEVPYKEQTYEEAPTETIPVEKIKANVRAKAKEMDEDVYKTLTAKKDNGFHLTPEQCRSNALASAIKWDKGLDIVNIFKVAKDFEKYILGEDE